MDHGVLLREYENTAEVPETSDKAPKALATQHTIKIKIKNRGPHLTTRMAIFCPFLSSPKLELSKFRVDMKKQTSIHYDGYHALLRMFSGL